LRRFLLACWLSLPCGAAPAQEGVVLQLKWSHAFQFAGYDAARKLGYYREAGLEVTLRPGQPGAGTMHEVAGGRAQYGVGNSSLLLAREDAIPHGPEDLAGKRIMIESQLNESLAYLRQLGCYPRPSGPGARQPRRQPARLAVRHGASGTGGGLAADALPGALQPRVLPAAIWRGELEHPHKDGHMVWTETTASAVRDSGGANAGLMGVSRDITAQRLQGAVRAADSLARSGGGKLCAALRPPFDLDGHQVTISASIGIALYPGHGEDDITLSKHADTAMYVAKQDGSDRAYLHGNLHIPE
jgi:hypothetical protein